MAAALQSSATALIDVSVGSVIRAVFEANAAIALWMQWLILQVLQTTRASTSSGSDLDSWMRDFGLSRLPAVPSSGIATFSRYTPSLSAIVPVGSVVKTVDGTLSFSVVEDSSISIWNAAGSGYVIPSGVNSADLPVVCITAGSAGNVLSGTINVIAASLPGVDQVTNTNPLTNGIDAESDTAFRSRFQGYLTSRSRATPGAIQNAVISVRQGLRVVIAPNTAGNGQPMVGAFLVVVDDGSGYPSADLLSSVATAIEAVRPIGTTFTVIPPLVLTVNVSLTAEFGGSAQAPSDTSAIQQYIGGYLNNLGIGDTVSVTRIAQQAYQAVPRIGNVTNILLNGTPLDVVPPPYTVIKAGSIAVSTNGG
ncbi:MAG TPA: baseplate protein [Acetobacteraceae bacterium]|nr:baseplate protein [Acetobacteraceae bacterium]